VGKARYLILTHSHIFPRWGNDWDISGESGESGDVMKYGDGSTPTMGHVPEGMDMGISINHSYLSVNRRLPGF